MNNLSHQSNPAKTAIQHAFAPQTSDEATASRVNRLMLYYHILRVQLEGARAALKNDEPLLKIIKHQAVQIRRQGFIEERDAISKGAFISYDDIMLRAEGTRIAYLIRDGEYQQAFEREERVITIAVHKALYGRDEEYEAIAA